jgi:hypothetical protein
VPRVDNVNFAPRAAITVPTRVQVVEVPSALIESIRAAGLGDEPKEECTLSLEGPSISVEDYDAPYATSRLDHLMPIRITWALLP